MGPVAEFFWRGVPPVSVPGYAWAASRRCRRLVVASGNCAENIYLRYTRQIPTPAAEGFTVSNVISLKTFSAQLQSPPIRKPNADLRAREYLRPDEVSKLIDAADIGRYAARDQALILMAYRHALRATEVVDLRWEHIDMKRATIHVERAKNGLDATHLLGSDELKLLRKLEPQQTGYVFQSERGGALTTRALHKIVARAGVAAGIAFSVHPHMLRHSKGYQLQSSGVDLRVTQAYLGHRSITNTVRYTALNPRAFTGLQKGDLK